MTPGRSTVPPWRGVLRRASAETARRRRSMWPLPEFGAIDEQALVAAADGGRHPAGGRAPGHRRRAARPATGAHVGDRLRRAPAPSSSTRSCRDGPTTSWPASTPGSSPGTTCAGTGCATTTASGASERASSARTVARRPRRHGRGPPRRPATGSPRSPATPAPARAWCASRPTAAWTAACTPAAGAVVAAAGTAGVVVAALAAAPVVLLAAPVTIAAGAGVAATGRSRAGRSSGRSAGCSTPSTSTPARPASESTWSAAWPAALAVREVAESRRSRSGLTACESRMPARSADGEAAEDLGVEEAVGADGRAAARG